ncbi:MAG: DUF305 domain-containing protein [Neisseriaceae bacterium]|nr:DUF305 domain-containing protein [Neisseriaceae bacterium]
MNFKKFVSALTVFSFFVVGTAIYAAEQGEKTPAKVTKTASKQATKNKKNQSHSHEHSAMGEHSHGEGHTCPMMEARKNKDYVPSPSENTLNTMHKPMMGVAPSESGSVERDFLVNMVPHHQGAVDSSKLVLEHGKSKKVQKIAKNIIKAQEKEIAQFNQLLAGDKLQKTEISAEDYQKFLADNKKLSDDMMYAMGAVKPTDDLDRNFLEAMIEHHKGAVNSSKQILQYSQDKTVRKIAEKIIKDQEKEIAEFSEMLQNNTL